MKMKAGIILLLSVFLLGLAACKSEKEDNTTAQTSQEAPQKTNTANRLDGIDFTGKTGIEYGGQMPKVDNMNSNMFRELVQSGKYVILDIRADNHYQEGHIEGAVSFPFSDPKFKENIKKLDKGAAYLIYSQRGINSVKAMVALRDEGINHVINLIGGTDNWVKNYGFPLVR